MLSATLSKYSSVAICAVRAVAVFCAFGVATNVAAQGDAERGAVLADTCKGCHAVDTYNNVYPTYHVPRIGGQSAEYIATALTLYRDGGRDHATMTAQAASYSDQDILDIAAYLSSAVPPLAVGEAMGQAPEAATVCASCHGANGVGQINSYPYLAGQHQDYLEQALSQYQSGARKGANAMVMQAQLMTVSDQDLQAIAAFYAHQDGLQSLPMD
jgi:cytochrome c553